MMQHSSRSSSEAAATVAFLLGVLVIWWARVGRGGQGSRDQVRAGVAGAHTGSQGCAERAERGATAAARRCSRHLGREQG